MNQSTPDQTYRDKLVQRLQMTEDEQDNFHTTLWRIEEIAANGETTEADRLSKWLEERLIRMRDEEQNES